MAQERGESGGRTSLVYTITHLAVVGWSAGIDDPVCLNELQTPDRADVQGRMCLL